MCVASQHAPLPTVRPTWERIGSRPGEKSGVMWQDAPVSNIYTSYVLSLAVVNPEPEAIVGTE